MRLYTKKLIAFTLAIITVISIYKVPVEAAPKTTLQTTKVALPERNGYFTSYTTINIYNATAIPKWTIKNNKIAYLESNDGKTATGSKINIYAKKAGKTTLTAKVGKKTYTVDVTVYDQKAALKNVSYSVKKVSDNVFAITMNNKNSYPVNFKPGIQYYNDKYEKGSLHSITYEIPAKTKVTRYYSWSNCYAAEKSSSNSSVSVSLVKAKKNITTKVDKLDYSFGTVRADITVTNKNTVPVNVNLAVIFYDENKKIIGVYDHNMSWVSSIKIDPNGTYTLQAIPWGGIDSKTQEKIKSCKVVVYTMS